jgi:hypothetical protein
MPAIVIDEVPPVLPDRCRIEICGEIEVFESANRIHKPFKPRLSAAFMSLCAQITAVINRASRDIDRLN